MPLPRLVEAIRGGAVRQDKNWFAYKTSEEVPQAFLAGVLAHELGLTFEPPDVALTAGAFAAISVAFRLLLDAGDAVVFCEPGWFCYEPMLLAADAVPRKVPDSQEQPQMAGTVRRRRQQAAVVGARAVWSIVLERGEPRGDVPLRAVPIQGSTRWD